MKKTLLATAVLFAMGSTSTLWAGDDEVDSGPLLDTSLDSGGAHAEGVESSATVSILDSANIDSSNSFNATLHGSLNDVNSDNLVEIGEDGIVLYANNADQAIATSDLDSTVSGNEVAIGSVINDNSPASPITNIQGGATEDGIPTGNSYSSTNTMTDSFSNAAGIAVVSQNTGHASSIQQSVVVQSNFQLN